MPVARYWRLVGVKTYGGGDLSLSEVQLYGAGGRLDAGATLTSSHPPISGALANLSDNSTATACTFAAEAVQSPGFYLMWDMGASATADVWGLRIGSSSSKDCFLSTCDLQYLKSDGTWDSASIGAFAWPGDSGLTLAPVSPAFFGIEPGVTAFQNAGSRFWTAAAIAGKSRAMVACVMSGYIYTSIDDGKTWVLRAGAADATWNTLAISEDGLRIIALPYGGPPRASTDGGATWAILTAAGARNWLSVAMSADGMRIVAGAESGNPMLSLDGGVSWSAASGAGTGQWFAVAMSSNGQHIAVASYNGGYIQVSADGGATWSSKTSAGSYQWWKLALSANGQKIAASRATTYDVRMSADGGNTWADAPLIPQSDRGYIRLGMSDDGQFVWAAPQYVPWQVSKDGGATWSVCPSTGSQNWTTMSVTADGRIAVSPAYGGLIYRVSERQAGFVEPPISTDNQSSFSVASDAPVPPHSTPIAPRIQTARDTEHGGAGTIYGTTKTKGTPNAPTKSRVVLQHQRSKLPVRETWSDPVTGAFVFTGVDTSQQFLALAEDAEGHFRPVAANRLTPEVLA